MTFENRISVITGAASGIGRSLALLLAKYGCHLALCDIDKLKLEEAKREVNKINGDINLSIHVFDVSNYEDYERAVGEIIDHHHGVNYVFNNAGMTIIDSATPKSMEASRRVMEVNYWGLVYGTTLFMPHLINQNCAHIINVSSVYGFVTAPTQAAYCASKFAIKGYTESLAQEYAESSVKFHCVHPAGVRTEILNQANIIDMTGFFDSEQSVKRMFSTMTWLDAKQSAVIILRGVAANKFRIHVGIVAHFLHLFQRIFPTWYMPVIRLWMKIF